MFSEFSDKHGIHHEFSAPRTPQQNGVAKRKNRHVQEMARTMLNTHNLPKSLRAEAVHIACYTINRVYDQEGYKDYTL